MSKGRQIQFADVEPVFLRYLLGMKAELNALDAEFSQNWTNAATAIDDLKTYAIKRFELNAEYLLPLARSETPEAINPQFRLALQEVKKRTTSFVSDKLSSAPKNLIADVTRGLSDELDASELKWISHA